MEILEDFHKKVRAANADRDWSLVEAMIEEHAIVRMQTGVREGRDAVIELVKKMARERQRVSVVGPRGGLISVLVSQRSSTRRVEHEQIYRLHDDKIAEIIDLDRTPDQVHRLRSQPN